MAIFAKPFIGGGGVTNVIGVVEGICIITNSVGVEAGVEVFLFCPTMVGVTVKVGEGTVGVSVGTSVAVFVKKVGTTVTVGGIPKNSLTDIEQAEINAATIRKINIFFM